MRTRILLTGFLTAFFSYSVVRADTTLESETTGGAGSLTEIVTLAGSSGAKNGKKAKSAGQKASEDETPVDTDWSLALNKSNQAPDATNPATQSLDLAGTLGWLINHSFDVGASVDTGTGGASNQGRYDNTGGNASLGYKFNWGQAEDSSEDDDSEPFNPSLEFKGTFYYEGYSTPGGKLKKPLGIGQYGYGGEVDFSPWEWITAKGTYASYRYTQDVALFTNALDSPRGLMAKLGGLGSAASGLPADLSTFTLTFYPMDPWQLDLEADGTLSAYDGSYARAFKATISADATDWLKIGVGYEKDSSVLIPNQDMGILNLTFTL